MSINNMGGYTGVILRVNLSTKKIVKEPLNKDSINKFIGGRGLNLKYLYDEIEPGIDALGPDNKIILGVGPCTGTLAPGSQRFTITAKSPLTGFLGYSNSGGDLGAELKYAGYDMVIIEGESQVPVYLCINDENVELRNASHLWGRTTRETRRAIERDVNDPQACIASIGPGGENLVRFACVMTELGRASGRTGMGAVFGAKKLKALAVRGTRGVKVFDYDMLKELCKKDREAWLHQDLEVFHSRYKYGVTTGTELYDRLVMHSTRNHQRGSPLKPLYHEEMLNYLLKTKACISCPAPCNHSYLIRKGPYAGTYGEGLEAAQLEEAGCRIGNDNAEVTLRVSTLLDEYGIDATESGSTLAFVMECYEKGILTKDDANGLELEWGNAQAILGLLEMITYRRGIGDILSQGLKKTSEAIGRGADKYAMIVKGASMIGRNVRACKGWALGFAVSNKGAHHMPFSTPEGSPIEMWDTSIQKLLEKYNDPINPLSEEGKGEIVKWYENQHAFEDCMEFCRFSLRHKDWSLPQIEAEFFNSVTGSNISSDAALHIGERIINLEKAFNIREGLARKDDSLPDRMTKEPMPDGPGKGQVVDLERMLQDYYESRGWDKDSGFPTRKKLLELDLGDVVDELEKMGAMSWYDSPRAP